MHELKNNSSSDDSNGFYFRIDSYDSRRNIEKNIDGMLQAPISITTDNNQTLTHTITDDSQTSISINSNSTIISSDIVGFVIATGLIAGLFLYGYRTMK